MINCSRSAVIPIVVVCSSSVSVPSIDMDKDTPKPEELEELEELEKLEELEDDLDCDELVNASSSRSL